VNALDRAVEFERRYSDGLVEKVVPARHGHGRFTPELPLVRYLNYYAVDVGARAGIEELVAVAEELHSTQGLAHRKIAIDDDLGRELESAFRERGWRHEELLVMPHGGASPDVDVSVVEEVEPEELEPVWVDGMRASPELESEEEIRQLVEAQHRRRRAVGVRYFAARADDRIASYCELFSDGGTGQIESVMTLEPYRGRGLAKAVVTRALRESRIRHDFTFLVADASDWPQHLYRKLGFESVGSIWDFLLLDRDNERSGGVVTA
jgi:ribosomal protein S18 acetylase RimI-like enzyme